MRASLQAFITVFFIFAIASGPLLVGQEELPPPNFDVELIATDYSGAKGTLDDPLSGNRSIQMLTEVLNDPDPSGYQYTDWSVRIVKGSFCLPCRGTTCRLIGAEGPDPIFQHTRVRSNEMAIAFSVSVFKTGFQLATARTTVHLKGEPGACSDDSGGDGPFDVQLAAPTGSVPLGSTIKLLGNAHHPGDDQLTFLFYAATASGQRGSLIDDRSASKCDGPSGCSLEVSFPAGDVPATHFFTLEVSDGTNTVSSVQRQVRVSENGDPPLPDDPERTWTECGSCGSRVDAGPLESTVVGGEDLKLRGSVRGPSVDSTLIPGIFEWIVLDDGGLGSSLQIVADSSLGATLLTPEVNQDTEIVLGLEATFNGCGCVDPMRVIILAQPPPEAADVSVAVSAPASAELGEGVSFTLNVFNQGPEAADDVKVTATLPQGLTLNSTSSSSGSCSQSNQVVTCSLGTMSAGSSATVGLLTAPGGPGDWVVAASVSAEQDDPNSGNNTSEALSHVTQSALDLALAMTGPGPDADLRVDGEVVYEITVKNLSSGVANNVTVINPLSEQLLFVRANPDRGSCSLRINTREILCRLGRLQGGDEPRIEVRVRARQPGSFVNSATVTADEEDSQPDDNVAGLEWNVKAEEADLAVALEASSDRLNQNGLLTYSITVSNAGPGKVEEVTVSGPVPAGLTSPSASTEQGTCTVSEEEISCTLGALEADEQVTITVEGMASTEGVLVYTVEVGGSEEDPNMENNSDRVEILVEALEFTLVPFSLGLPDTFVSMALVNLAGGPNFIEIEAVGRDGVIQSSASLESDSDRSQAAFLTNQLFPPQGGVDEEATLVARGTQGRIRSFFMMGDNGLRKLDGIGGSMAEGEELYFPMVRGQEANTLLFLFNPGQEEAPEVLLELFDAEGHLLQTALASLAPLGSLRGSVGDVFGEADLDEGYVRVASAVPLRGFEVVSDNSNFASLTAKRPEQVRRLIVPHFLATADATTWLHLLNLNDSPAGGTVHLFDDDGEELAATALDLEALSLSRIDLQDLFDFEELDLITGYLEIRISGGTAGVFEKAAEVVATVSYESESFHAALPMAQEGFQETFFLHVAQSDEIGMFHGLAILNRSQELAQGLVSVYDKEGLKTGEAEFTLEPGERVVDLLNGPEFFQSGFSQIQGHILITSDQPVISFALFGAADFLAAIEGQGVEEER